MREILLNYATYYAISVLCSFTKIFINEPLVVTFFSDYMRKFHKNFSEWLQLFFFTVQFISINYFLRTFFCIFLAQKFTWIKFIFKQLVSRCCRLPSSVLKTLLKLCAWKISFDCPAVCTNVKKKKLKCVKNHNTL